MLADGFTFRGQHCSLFGINLLSYRIHDPDLREYEDEADGRAGTIDYGSEFSKRAIDLKIDIEPNDMPFRLRQSQIYNWLKPTLPAGILVFDEIPDRFFYAKLTGRLSPEQFYRYGTFDLTLKCTDPFAYGPEIIHESTITASPTPIDIQSLGSEPTPPLIELTNTGSTTINLLKLQVEYQIE